MTGAQARVPMRYFLPLLAWRRGEGSDVARLRKLAEVAHVPRRHAHVRIRQKRSRRLR